MVLAFYFGKPFIYLQLMVKSDSQAISENSDLCRNCFLKSDWGGQCPNSKFSKLLKLSETSRDRKLIFELHVNIDKANNRIYDVTR